MGNIFSIFIVLSTLLGAVTACASEDVTAEVIFRGTFRSALERPSADDPPLPKVNLGSSWVGPRPRHETARVVGFNGLDFGLLFVPRASGLPGMPISLKYVTRFPAPGLLKPGSAAPLMQVESQISCLVGVACTAHYTFDESWEIVPGIWRFEIYDGNKKLLEESIEVQVSRS